MGDTNAAYLFRGISIQELGDFDKDGNYKFKTAAINTIYGYLQDEIDAIKQYRQALKEALQGLGLRGSLETMIRAYNNSDTLNRQLPKGLVQNYHFTLEIVDGKPKYTLGGKGGQLRAFSSLNSRLDDIISKMESGQDLAVRDMLK